MKWIASYQLNNLRGDLFAGITVGVMLIPQGMAYAMLAGLPPIFGLYAATIPLIIYALLGTSGQLAVGPVAMVSLLIAGGLSPLEVPGSDSYASLAILLALLVGIIQLLMGIFKLGFLVNFLSRPVISGFLSAAGIIIVISQLQHILGISLPRGKIQEILGHLGENISQTNWITFGLGVVSVLILLIIKFSKVKIPGPLLVVLGGTLAAYFFQLDSKGVQIVGDIPSGLPGFFLPVVDLARIQSLLPIALAISFVGYMQSFAMAKAFQSYTKDQKILPNRELVSLGVANIVGSFFQSFPVSGGLSRTAVNSQAGAKSGLASIFSAILVLVTLLFFTKYFYFLPKAVLGAIILVAVYKLIDFHEAIYLWKHDKKDFSVFILTAIVTLILGIQEGVFAGVILSLVLLIYKSSYPHIAELGRVPGSQEFRNIERFPNLETYEEILVLRFDATLFFANAPSLKTFIDDKLSSRKNIKYVVLDCSAITNLDSTGIKVLQEIVGELHAKGRDLYLTNVRGPIRDSLQTFKLLRENNEHDYYISNHDAIQDLTNQSGNTFQYFAAQTTPQTNV